MTFAAGGGGVGDGHGGGGGGGVTVTVTLQVLDPPEPETFAVYEVVEAGLTRYRSTRPVLSLLRSEQQIVPCPMLSV